MCGFDGGLRGLQVGARFARGVLLLVVIALGDRVVGDQTLRTLPIALRVARARLRCRKLGFGAIDFGGIRTRIDHEQRVALLYERAVLEVDGHDRARHLRTDVHFFDRFEAARIALPVGDGLLHHSGDIDLRHDGRCGGRARVDANGAERAQPGHGDDDERGNRHTATGKRKDSHVKLPVSLIKVLLIGVSAMGARIEAPLKKLHRFLQCRRMIG